MNWSPPIRTSQLRTLKGSITVVRDDYLNGGTKQRAIIPFLMEKKEFGFHEFVYASPFSGYAQIALAYSCSAVDLDCVIFAESQLGEISGFTAKIKDLATIHLTDDLSQAEQEAEQYVESAQGAMKIPLGFADLGYVKHLKDVLEREWQNLVKKVGKPRNIWLPVGSGILARTFRDVAPPETKLICVDVRVLRHTDQRIQTVAGLENVDLLRVPEKFSQACERPPSIPSNSYYDAKLWRFIAESAEDGDVWWNVAS